MFTLTCISTIPAIDFHDHARMARSPTSSRPAAPAETQPDIDAAIVIFQKAYLAVVGGADELLAQQGLGRSHHKILFHVARHPRCSVTDVREFIGVTRQALQRPLNDLHRLGHIETLVSPHNRRVHQLLLTPEGARYEQAVSALVQVHFQTAFAAVGAPSQAQWQLTMQALVDSAAVPASSVPTRLSPKPARH